MGINYSRLSEKEIFALLRATNNSKLKKDLRFELSIRNNVSACPTSKCKKVGSYTVYYGVDKNLVEDFHIKSQEDLEIYKEETLECAEKSGETITYCHCSLQPCGVAYVIAYEDED